MSKANTLAGEFIRGEVLKFGGNERWTLGPDLRLEDCHVELDRCTWRTLQLDQVSLTACTVVVRGALENFASWCRCAIQSCRFRGTLSGNTFGSWPEEHGSFGTIQQTDFSDARLQGCQFMRTPPTSLRLPSWPHFTVLDPYDRERELLNRTWPGDLAFWAEAVLTCPEGTTALVCDATELIPEFCPDLATLRTHLEGVPGIAT